MAGVDVFFGGETAVRVEQLAALRRQRMRLGALCDDVDVARRAFGRVDGAAGFRSWRSPAARGYAARRSDISADLDLLLLTMRDALEAIERAIAELKALL